jgi:DNA-binding LacI/PurR family transcriptional regulator
VLDAVKAEGLPAESTGTRVTANNEEGTLNATRHLIDMGHKGPQMIVGPPAPGPMRRAGSTDSDVL